MVVTAIVMAVFIIMAMAAMMTVAMGPSSFAITVSPIHTDLLQQR